MTEPAPGQRCYRYYLFTTAQKSGWAQCPSKAVPAGPLEGFVVDRIRCVDRDPAPLRSAMS